MDFDDLNYRQEWEALQVTYPELNLPNEPPNKGTSFQLCFQVDLPRDYSVYIFEEAGDRTAQPKSIESIQISHLPPIYMDLLLPPLYPHEPPQIVSLSSMHDWLADLSLQQLTKDLMAIWDREKSIILALWLDHIRDGEVLLNSLQLLCDDKILIRKSALIGGDLLRSLQKYDCGAKRVFFNNSKYRCPVCFDRLQGVECVSLTSCEHVACKKCLRDGWSLYISEGRSELVGCPDPECMKQKRTATIQDVQIVLSPEEISRWLWLIRKQETEKDPTIVFCPQVLCQRPVKKEPPVQGQSTEWERLRTCDCGFTFCVYCRRTWHGPHLPCPLPASEEFVKKYIELPSGSPEKLILEKRYGSSNLTKLVGKHRENELNRSWLERETMPCPGCQVRVQKSMGCNHMTCAKCKQHFCYRCGTKIQAKDPYAHFSTKGLPCYSKLFEGVQQEDDDAWD